MLRSTPTSSSSLEEIFEIPHAPVQQARDVDVNDDSFEILDSLIQPPQETQEDKKAIQEAWVDSDNLEDVIKYIDDARGERIMLAARLLAGIDLSAKQLSHAKFQWADLKKSKFCRATLVQVNFHAATLLEADFTEANTLFVDLSETYAIGAIFNNANLDVGSFNNSYMQSTQFIKASLRGILGCSANFYAANFQGATLTEANLENANLSQSNLENANLVNARLLKTNFSDANLNKCQLKGARFFPDADNLNEAILKDYLDCYAGFYMKAETHEINKSLIRLISYMREDLILKIQHKSYRSGVASVEKWIAIASEHPLFSTHKKSSTYRLNSFFSNDDEHNAILTKSQRAFAQCYKELVKQQAKKIAVNH